MKHREQHDEAIVVHHGHDLPAALDVVEQVAVRKHRALGAAGRAGGVDDDGEIVALRGAGGIRQCCVEGG